MRICVFNPGVVHAIPRTISFAKYFSEVHYVDVRGKDDRNLLEKHNIIYHGPFKSSDDEFNCLRIQKFLNVLSPDGIVCHFASGGQFFHSILYNKCPVAVIAMGHDVLYDKGDSNIDFSRKLLIRMALRRASYVSAKSQFIRNRIKKYGVKSPIRVNYWGIDLSKFKSRNKIKYRKKIGLNVDWKIILSPRAIEPRLNIHLIVKSMEYIRDKIPTAYLIILGRTDEGYKDSIESLARKKGLLDNIKFVYEVDRDKIIDYYNASDVIVSVASSDGFPNTILEVLACKRPVVVGRIPQIQELLTNDVNSKLCKINVEEIANKVIDVLLHYNAYHNIIKMGRQTVNKFANINLNGKIFADDFRQVILKYRRKKFPSPQWLFFASVFFIDFLQRRIVCKFK